MGTEMQEMVGRKVLGIGLGENDWSIVFDTDAGPVWYEALGDCCSESWFADGVGVESLLGGTVVRVEQIEMPNGYRLDDGRSRQQEDTAFGYRFTTNRGRFDLIFRNSSNGYYGGWAEYRSSAPPQTTEMRDDWAH